MSSCDLVLWMLRMILLSTIDRAFIGSLQMATYTVLLDLFGYSSLISCQSSISSTNLFCSFIHLSSFSPGYFRGANQMRAQGLLGISWTGISLYDLTISFVKLSRNSLRVSEESNSGSGPAILSST